jgi:hypothetical protein
MAIDRAPRAAGQLCGHRGDRGEHPAGRRELGPERHRPGRRHALADHRDAEDETEHQIGRDPDDQRGRQLRVPAHRRRPDQLGTAGLLVRTRVPDDREYGEERDDHRDEAGPPGDQLADAGAGQLSVQRDEAGVVHADVRVVLPFRGGRE